MNDTSFDITKESNPVQTVAPIDKEDNEMLRATEKITALYCRLSVEDTKDEKKNGKEDPSELHSASTGHAYAVCQSQPPAEPDLLY